MDQIGDIDIIPDGESQRIEDRKQRRPGEELIEIGPAVEYDPGVLQEDGFIPEMGIGQGNGSDQERQQQDDGEKEAVIKGG